MYTKLDKDTELTAKVDLLAAAALDERRTEMVSSWNCSVPIPGTRQTDPPTTHKGQLAGIHVAMCQQSALLSSPPLPPPLTSDLDESWVELGAADATSCVLKDPGADLPSAVSRD